MPLLQVDMFPECKQHFTQLAEQVLQRGGGGQTNESPVKNPFSQTTSPDSSHSRAALSNEPDDAIEDQLLAAVQQAQTAVHTALKVLDDRVADLTKHLQKVSKGRHSAT